MKSDPDLADLKIHMPVPEAYMLTAEDHSVIGIMKSREAGGGGQGGGDAPGGGGGQGGGDASGEKKTVEQKIDQLSQKVDQLSQKVDELLGKFSVFSKIVEDEFKMINCMLSGTTKD
jgi:hypothetical protein